MRKALGQDLAASTTWSVETKVDQEMAGGPNRAPAVHGLARYLPMYESRLDRTKPIRMLVIGSFYEDSLTTWQDYLHPGSFLVCADGKSKLLKIAESGNTYVRMCEERHGSLLEKVATEFGPFDVILDKGSHTSSHMVDSFRSLFTTALGDGGTYMVEDVYYDYWTPYRDRRLSFIEFVKALIDAMHAHYQVVSTETASEVGHPGRIREVSVPAITPVLGGIEVYDSIVVVHRATPDPDEEN
ncbi:hypothetical protein A5739_03915 [Mycobacterium colombiense]|nr:hypothetical protein A5739_03915 [Mycobacterium colombiense]